MNEIIKSIVKDPFEAFGYVILAIFMVGLVIRFGKEVWNEVVNDKD